MIFVTARPSCSSHEWNWTTCHSNFSLTATHLEKRVNTYNFSRPLFLSFEFRSFSKEDCQTWLHLLCWWKCHNISTLHGHTVWATTAALFFLCWSVKKFTDDLGILHHYHHLEYSFYFAEELPKNQKLPRSVYSLRAYILPYRKLNHQLESLL